MYAVGLSLTFCYQQRTVFNSRNWKVGRSLVTIIEAHNFFICRASIGLKQSLVTDDQLNSYCNLLFGGWDYCIADEKAASLKHNSLKYELQVNMNFAINDKVNKVMVELLLNFNVTQFYVKH